MTRFFLIRHGENPANLTRAFSYRLVDFPLTERGRLQAEQTAEHLSTCGIRHIYSSPLKRALETAHAVAAACNAPLTILEAFREVNVGRLEAEAPSDANWALHDDLIRSWAGGRHDARFPDGEDYLSLLERVSEGYRSILASEPRGPVAVVAHGGSLGLPLLSLCSESCASILRQDHPNCAVSELELRLEDGKLTGRLLYFADTSHLKGDALPPVNDG